MPRRITQTIDGTQLANKLRDEFRSVVSNQRTAHRNRRGRTQCTHKIADFANVVLLGDLDAATIIDPANCKVQVATQFAKLMCFNDDCTEAEVAVDAQEILIRNKSPHVSYPQFENETDDCPIVYPAHRDYKSKCWEIWTPGGAIADPAPTDCSCKILALIELLHPNMDAAQMAAFEEALAECECESDVVECNGCQMPNALTAVFSGFADTVIVVSGVPWSFNASELNGQSMSLAGPNGNCCFVSTSVPTWTATNQNTGQSLPIVPLLPGTTPTICYVNNQLPPPLQTEDWVIQYLQIGGPFSLGGINFVGFNGLSCGDILGAQQLTIELGSPVVIGSINGTLTIS